MERALLPSPGPFSAPQALVINVADAQGLDIVRRLAELGVGVVIHFTAHRRSVNRLIQDVWDQGGWIRAFDGSRAVGGGDEALRAAWATFGGGRMVFDALSPPGTSEAPTARGRPRNRPLREPEPCVPWGQGEAQT